MSYLKFESDVNSDSGKTHACGHIHKGLFESDVNSDSGKTITIRTVRW